LAHINATFTSEATIMKYLQKFAGAMNIVGIDIHPDRNIEVAGSNPQVLHDSLEGAASTDSRPHAIMHVWWPIEGYLGARHFPSGQFYAHFFIKQVAIGNNTCGVMRITHLADIHESVG